jgi:hypothetical protein
MPVQSLELGAATAARPRRESADAFRRLPLAVHSVLHDVPLHDVTVVDLPNGGPGRTLADVRAFLPGGGHAPANGPTRALFRLRLAIGRVLGWDAPKASRASDSYRQRIPEDVQKRSVVQTSGEAQTFDRLYELDHEALLEVHNATVHAFLAIALLPMATGYRMYWAVYVKPVSRFTALYMAVIEPFRRFIVYPSLLRSVQEAWETRFPVSSTRA